MRVGDAAGAVVGGGVGGAVGAAVPAHVGSDGTPPGARERGQLVSPGEGEPGEAVAEHDWWTPTPVRTNVSMPLALKNARVQAFSAIVADVTVDMVAV